MPQILGFIDPDSYLFLSARQKIQHGKQIAREESDRFRGHHNDRQDGLRHAEWSRKMAEEIDPTFAFGAGLFHEIEGLVLGDQPLSEAMMDLSNNAVGLRAAGMGRSVNPSDIQEKPRNYGFRGQDRRGY